MVKPDETQLGERPDVVAHVGEGGAEFLGEFLGRRGPLGEDRERPRPQRVAQSLGDDVLRREFGQCKGAGIQRARLCAASACAASAVGRAYTPLSRPKPLVSGIKYL